MGRIGLKGVKVSGHIGVTEDERHIGRNFLVDIEVDYPLSEAGRTDELSATINYEILQLIIHAEMQRPFRLLEAAAHTIATEILKMYPDISGIDIKIKKLRPFLKGEVTASFVEWSYPEDF